MLTRSKKICELVLRELAKPAVIIALPHDLRVGLADLAAELVDINQRLEILEREQNGKN